jgi:hypothetical protein
MKILVKTEGLISTRTTYLISKRKDFEVSGEGILIEVDKANNFFSAKRVNVVLNSEGSHLWEEFNDYTFPSSIFNDFLMNASVEKLDDIQI